MNQDFTVKKSNICLKKKFVQRVSPGKKPAEIPAPHPPPPITFLMVCPLSPTLPFSVTNNEEGAKEEGVGGSASGKCKVKAIFP